MSNIYWTCIVSLIITLISIPSLIKVARIKKLYDEPDQRKNHSCVIPTLGGVAIFAGFIKWFPKKNTYIASNEIYNFCCVDYVLYRY